MFGAYKFSMVPIRSRRLIALGLRRWNGKDNVAFVSQRHVISNKEIL